MLGDMMLGLKGPGLRTIAQCQGLGNHNNHHSYHGIGISKKHEKELMTLERLVGVKVSVWSRMH